MISAKIGKDVVTQTGDGAVILTTDFHRANLGATMNRRLHVLTTRLDPFDRFAQLYRNPTEQGFFRINIKFRAEAAANFRRDYSELVFSQADPQRALVAQAICNLL